MDYGYGFGYTPPPIESLMTYQPQPGSGMGFGVLRDPGSVAYIKPQFQPTASVSSQPDYSAFGGMSLAGGFLGSAFSAWGSYQAGQAAEDAYAFQAKVAKLQAAEALKRGQVQEFQYRLGLRQLIGTQRAQLAAQGADLSQDTALRIQTDSQYIGALDALMIRNNARMQAWGYQVQAAGANIAGQEAAAAGVGRAGATMLTGLGDTGYSFFKLQSAGAFG